MALPVLDAMLPRLRARCGGRRRLPPQPRRADGLHLRPQRRAHGGLDAGEGRDRLRAAADPAAAGRRTSDDVLVLSGLTCDKARANGDGAGDHARASAAFLTGAQARKTAGANFRAGVSADQIAAQQLGDQTRLPSLELGIERFRGTGNCDSGYSCVYEHTLAWRNADHAAADRGQSQADLRPPLRRPAERPRPAEARAACGPACSTPCSTTPMRWRSSSAAPTGRSSTSTCRASATSKSGSTGPRSCRRSQLPEGTKQPEQLPADLTEHFRLMSDLMVLAFQTDVTRIATFMFGREGSEQKYTMVGVNEGHHRSRTTRTSPSCKPRSARSTPTTSSSSPTCSAS